MILQQIIRQLTEWQRRLFYRYVRRCFVTTTSLDKTHYWDARDRIFHAAFSELVDFVEVDLAWMMIVFSNEARRQYQVRFWHYLPMMRFVVWRNRLAGLDYLQFLIQTSRNSKEYVKILQLYHWWVHVRPNRPAYDDVAAMADACKHTNFSTPSGDHIRQLCAADMYDDIFEDEDDEALRILMSVRDFLWT